MDKTEEIDNLKTAFIERRARAIVAAALSAACAGEFEEAKQKMAQAYDISPSCQVLLNWARLVYALEERSFAVDLCAQAISYDPENEEAKQLFATYLSSFGRAAEAKVWSAEPLSLI